MHTVKEIAELTGVSTRTLRYYDEIGLLFPTGKSESGYRLYDEKALERLQQILFFREFEIPLKEIKSILEHPDFDKNQILQMQRKMLVAKKDRLERLIASIDDILGGTSKVDFSVFDRTEVEEMFELMMEQMPENIRGLGVKEFGSLSGWKKHYIKTIEGEEMQERYREIFQLYGGKENYLSQMKQPVSKNEMNKFKEWEDDMVRRILDVQKEDNREDLGRIVREYGKGCREFFRMREEKMMMLSFAKSLRNDMVLEKFDERFGQGAGAVIIDAIEMEYM